MSKDTYYFQHDYNSRNDDRILELRAEFGAEGYGIWWMLVESIAETEDGYLKRDRIAGLSLGFGIDKGLLSKIIDFCIDIELLKVDKDYLYSDRMLEHKAIRKAAQEAGAKGAAKRWAKGKDSPPIGDPNSPPIADPNAKERKGKERKENTKEAVDLLSRNSTYKRPMLKSGELTYYDNDSLRKQYDYEGFIVPIEEAFKYWEEHWTHKRFEDLQHFNNWILAACREKPKFTGKVKFVS